MKIKRLIAEKIDLDVSNTPQTEHKVQYNGCGTPFFIIIFYFIFYYNRNELPKFYVGRNESIATWLEEGRKSLELSPGDELNHCLQYAALLLLAK